MDDYRKRNRLACKKYRDSHREIIRIKARERMRKKRLENPEKYRLLHKISYLKNKTRYQSRRNELRRKSYHRNKINRTKVNVINMLEEKTKFVIVKSL